MAIIHSRQQYLFGNLGLLADIARDLKKLISILFLAVFALQIIGSNFTPYEYMPTVKDLQGTTFSFVEEEKDGREYFSSILDMIPPTPPALKFDGFNPGDVTSPVINLLSPPPDRA